LELKGPSRLLNFMSDDMAVGDETLPVSIVEIRATGTHLVTLQVLVRAIGTKFPFIDKLEAA
jgi:hypothetical protein